MMGRSLAYAAMLLLVATPVLAEGTSAERAACTPDVFRLCASSIPDVDQIIVCLKKARPSLSAGCRVVMDNADKKVATRSVGGPSEWCHFETVEPTDADWHSWCDAKSTMQ